MKIMRTLRNREADIASHIQPLVMETKNHENYQAAMVTASTPFRH